jgi:hypothetical protein
VCRISVEFWSEAYEQVPAGSIPDDDVQLSDWAGFGRRNLTEWLAVKDEVMSAWVKCADGRWYHPTLCEVALTAWSERQDHLRRREEERQRKEAYRKRKGGGDDPVQDHGRDAGQTKMSHGTGAECPPENALKGTVTGTGILSSEANASSSDAFDDRLTDDFPPNAFSLWYDVYPHKVGRADADKKFAVIRKRGLATFAQLMVGRDRYIASKPPDRAWCNPATWLHQQRWLDAPDNVHPLKPAGSNGPPYGPNAKFAARQDNVASSVAGSEIAARIRAERRGYSGDP